MHAARVPYGREGVSTMTITPISAIEETVHGLFGAAQSSDGTTIWCRGRQVLERGPDGTVSGWRAMTMEDVEGLLALGAIDKGVRDRMEIRLMR